MAIQASDLTLMRSDLTSVGDAVRLSRATLRTIKGNLFWAFAYNVAALPLAAAGLLTPVIAAGAMALSSRSSSATASGSVASADFTLSGCTARQPRLLADMPKLRWWHRVRLVLAHALSRT